MRLSYVDGYLALSSEGVGFRQWRDEFSKTFEGLKAAGGGFESVDIQPPSVRISGSKRDYAFLPCVFVYHLSSAGARIRRTGFADRLSRRTRARRGCSWKPSTCRPGS